MNDGTVGPTPASVRRSALLTSAPSTSGSGLRPLGAGTATARRRRATRRRRNRLAAATRLRVVGGIPVALSGPHARPRKPRRHTPCSRRPRPTPRRPPPSSRPRARRERAHPGFRAPAGAPPPDPAPVGTDTPPERPARPLSVNGVEPLAFARDETRERGLTR